MHILMSAQYCWTKNKQQMKYFLTAIATVLIVACGNNNNASQPASTSATPATSPVAEEKNSEKPAEVAATLTCQLNGREWKGGNIYSGNLYYPKGISRMFNGKPYMMLSFRATMPPDNRQLTISFANFQGKTGTYAKEALEVLLSGAASGEAQKAELQGHKVPRQSTNFTVEITDWKVTGADEVIISGKLSGTLKGSLGSPDVTIENGQFNNVAIKIYPDKY
jgi:hypothetical protein